jgi:hypothetical protein
MKSRELLALLALHELAQVRILRPGAAAEPDTLTRMTFCALMDELDGFDDSDQAILDHYRERFEGEARTGVSA